MDLILPNRSLMIVDKGWLKEQGPDELASVGNQKKHPTSGRKTAVDDIAITVMGTPSGETAHAQEPQRTNEDSNKQNASSGPTQKLRFVNATTPAHNRDPEVRKLVRSHVRKRSSHDEKVRKGLRTKPNTASVTSLNARARIDVTSGERFVPSSPGPPPLGSTTPFYGGTTFPMNPRFYKLMNCYLDHIAHVLYPRESRLIFNPVKTDWFPLAVTDEVMLHTTLLAAAMHIQFSNSWTTTREPDLLTERILRQLNARLANRSELSDTTLGAIACLAMLENMQGHYDKWEMHVKGMAKIIEIRGGMSAIAIPLQMKLCRADIEGSVDSLSEPRLKPAPRLHPSIYSMMPTSEPGPHSNDLLAMLISSGVGSRLVTIFHDLSRFSYALQHALSSEGVLLHPRSFDEDVILTQYELLRCQRSNQTELEKALMLGALMYLKSVSRSTPLSPWSSANLTSRLRSILESWADDDVPARLLLVWLCFVGGCAFRGPNHAWFVGKLAQVVALEERAWTWEDARAALQKVLWVEEIHEDICKKLWDEI